MIKKRKVLASLDKPRKTDWDEWYRQAEEKAHQRLLSEAAKMVFSAQMKAKDHGKIIKTIAVDLDGTLAYYDKWRGIEHIGDPIPEMYERVKAWDADPKIRVIIFTARADDPDSIPYIRAWLSTNGLSDFLITNRKTPDIDEFWDDRCISVIQNTGKVRGYL